MQITGRKIVRSTAVYTVAKLALQVLMLVKVLVLARVLSPYDFGLMGIVTIVISTVESVTITGVELNLVRMQQQIHDYIDTAWTIAVVRGVILALCMYAASFPLAIFFHSPDSLPMLQFVSCVFIIRGLVNSHIIYFTKNLDIRRQLVLTYCELLTDLAVSLVLSFLLRNAWGLVFGFLAASAVRTCVSFMVHEDRPRFRYDPEKIRRLSRFGKHVWGTNIAVLATNKLDSIIIGRLLDAASLGLYQMAIKLTEPVSKEISSIMAQILMPAYSAMQNDRHRLTGAYFRTVKLTIILFLPLALLMGLYSSHVVPLLLGPHWEAIIPVIPLLISACFLRSLFSISTCLYYAYGRADYNFIIVLIRLCGIGILIVPLTQRLGIAGTALSVCLANALLFFPVIRYGSTMLHISPGSYLRNMFPPIGAALVTIIPSYLVGRQLPPDFWWSGAVMGAGTFAGMIYILEGDLCRELASKLKA